MVTAELTAVSNFKMQGPRKRKGNSVASVPNGCPVDAGVPPRSVAAGSQEHTLLTRQGLAHKSDDADGAAPAAGAVGACGLSRSPGLHVLTTGQKSLPG